MADAPVARARRLHLGRGCYPAAVFSSKELAPGTIMKLIAAQPHSWGKVEASWHLAVGGAMARMCSPVREAEGVVHVRAKDARVAEQLDLHRRVIEGRLRELLGEHGRTFTVEAGGSASRPSRT